MTQTILAFSKSWDEALDVYVRPLLLNIYAVSVESGDRAPAMTQVYACRDDPGPCRIGTSTPHHKTKAVALPYDHSRACG